MLYAARKQESDHQQGMINIFYIILENVDRELDSSLH